MGRESSSWRAFKRPGAQLSFRHVRHPRGTTRQCYCLPPELVRAAFGPKRRVSSKLILSSSGKKSFPRRGPPPLSSSERELQDNVRSNLSKSFPTWCFVEINFLDAGKKSFLSKGGPLLPVLIGPRDNVIFLRLNLLESLLKIAFLRI